MFENYDSLDSTYRGDRVGSTAPKAAVDPIGALTVILASQATTESIQAQQLTVQTFDWSTSHQSEEFLFFQYALNIWLPINKTLEAAEIQLDFVLNFPGKEGLQHNE